jgi:xanthine dehydrogenase YagR molybdenum-binding subunit
MKYIGKPIDRTDGKLKVTGEAPYAADFSESRMVHAALVTSTIAKGAIADINVGEAQAMPGVLYIMTYKNAMDLPNDGLPDLDPPAVRRLSLMQNNRVNYNNEPLALVVADTLEHAIDAANHVCIEYECEPAVLNFEQGIAGAYAPADAPSCPTDSTRGDFEGGVQSGDIEINAIYSTPMEHHNPMEPHATLACWDGPKLLVVDATQAVNSVRTTLSAYLGISKEDIRVIAPFLGGGFGTKGSPWSHIVLCAMAARQLGRPVRLELTRPQMFGSVGGRPNTQQFISMAATSEGEITALQHNSFSYTSFIEDWFEPACLPSRMLYDIPNVTTTHRVVQLNLGTPTFMRAPGETTGNFALESAIDELAYALKMDPLELRLKNYAKIDPSNGNPWSSKELLDCYTIGAEKFGWAERNTEPRARQEGNNLVGVGMATAMYPANRSAASAIACIKNDGTATVCSATHDIGTGAYTVMTQVAAEALGFPLEAVGFELGDSSLPKAPDASSSQSAASVSPAVASAAIKVRNKLIALAVGHPESPLHGVGDAIVVDGWVTSKANPELREPAAGILARANLKSIEAEGSAAPGAERDKYSLYSFGAVFAEVHVDADLGTVCVKRVVGVYDVGRVLNAKTAHSQIMGGIVWGVGAALEEQTVLEECCGRFVNPNLAEYHVPVNADIPDLDISCLGKPDPYINALGVRGVGEIGITGIIAAIANAVYNATGIRVRDLPITPDKLL